MEIGVPSLVLKIYVLLPNATVYPLAEPLIARVSRQWQTGCNTVWRGLEVIMWGVVTNNQTRVLDGFAHAYSTLSIDEQGTDGIRPDMRSV